MRISFLHGSVSSYWRITYRLGVVGLLLPKCSQLRMEFDFYMFLLIIFIKGVFGRGSVGRGSPFRDRGGADGVLGESQK